MNEQDLLLCPFCGSDKVKVSGNQARIQHSNRFLRKFYVRCFVCNARGPVVSADCGSDAYGTLVEKTAREKAVEQWNTRV